MLLDPTDTSLQGYGHVEANMDWFHELTCWYAALIILNALVIKCAIQNFIPKHRDKIQNKTQACVKPNPERYLSNAATIEGVCGNGAFISNNKPASSTALDVLFPKAPIFVPFCLNRGQLSKRLLTPLGVKKQITSNSWRPSTSFTSALMLRYI